jgi:arylsulfatase
VVHWPAGISAKGELRTAPAHLIDFVPTALEVAGVQKPAQWEGEPIPAAPGKSLVPAFSKETRIARESLWWLHEGNRAVRVDDWKLVAARGEPWELYDLKTDRAEQKNLVAQFPEKARALEQVWEKQAQEVADLAKKTLSEQPKDQPGKGKKGGGKGGGKKVAE